jgi:hypothetical protein
MPILQKDKIIVSGSFRAMSGAEASHACLRGRQVELILQNNQPMEGYFFAMDTSKIVAFHGLPALQGTGRVRGHPTRASTPRQPGITGAATATAGGRFTEPF